MGRSYVVFLVVLLLSQQCCYCKADGSWLGLTTAVAGGAGIMAVAPVALGALGFTSVGIAANSIAAYMMSASAVANGGGVVSGGLVAILQSAGAAGIGIATNVAIGTVGAFATRMLVG